jgi:hypothetical protein
MTEDLDLSATLASYKGEKGQPLYHPEQMSAYASYSSRENLAGLGGRNIDAYVATGRARDAVAGTAKDKGVPASDKVRPPTRLEARRANIKAVGHTGPYRLRNSPSRCSGRSNKRADSINSCCAASKR